MIEKAQDLVTQFSPATIGLIVFLLTQAAFGIIWITRQENRITALESQVKVQQVVMERIDAKEHEFDLRVTREATIMRGNIENARSDINRTQEQQQRIIQALDGISNTLQEHLRTHSR
jgi:hypothetical protein